MRRDKGQTLLQFAISVSLAGASVQTLKYLIGRARPNVFQDQTVFVGPFGLFSSADIGAIDSMPSGHTAAAFAMATALVYRWPQSTWLWFFAAIGVGVARTLIDAHFPSDVILGALLGTLIGILSHRRERQSDCPDNFGVSVSS